jgi:hypothetical protein
MAQMIEFFVKQKVNILAMFLSFLSIFSGACAQTPQDEEQNIISSSKPSVSISVELSIVGVPSLNQPVELTLAITPAVDAPNTTAQIILPEEFILIEGHSTWEGDIDKDDTFTLTATIKAVEEGDTIIQAHVLSGEPSYRFGKDDTLFISVYSDNAIVKHESTSTQNQYENATELNESE